MKDLKTLLLALKENIYIHYIRYTLYKILYTCVYKYTMILRKDIMINESYFSVLKGF